MGGARLFFVLFLFSLAVTKSYHSVRSHSIFKDALKCRLNNSWRVFCCLSYILGLNWRRMVIDLFRTFVCRWQVCWHIKRRASGRKSSRLWNGIWSKLSVLMKKDSWPALNQAFTKNGMSGVKWTLSGSSLLTGTKFCWPVFHENLSFVVTLSYQIADRFSFFVFSSWCGPIKGTMRIFLYNLVR